MRVKLQFSGYSNNLVHSKSKWQQKRFYSVIFPNDLALANNRTVKTVVFFVMVHVGIISRKLTRHSMKSQNTDCRMSYISIVCTLSL